MVPFVGPSHPLPLDRADLQRSINLYPVRAENAGEKSESHLMPTPGLSVWSGLPGGGAGFAQGDAAAGTVAPALPSHGVGDGLLFYVLHTSTFTPPTGWTLVDQGFDSSGGVNLRIYGRIADGSANDTPTYSSPQKTTWFTLLIRNVNDSHFPAGMNTGTDYQFGVAGGGNINPRPITKLTSGSQFVIAAGFLEINVPPADATITAVPTGYTKLGVTGRLDYLNGATHFFAELVLAQATVVGASIDPGPFNDGSGSYFSGGSSAATLAVTYTP